MRRFLAVLCTVILPVVSQEVVVRQAPASPPQGQSSSGGGGAGGPMRSGVPQQGPGALPEGQQKPPEKPASIEGRITAPGGEAVRKAEVMLQPMSNAMNMGPMGGQKATTDDSGAFKFSQVEPGQYLLRAQKNGFVPQSYGARRPGMGGGTTLTLAPGQEMANIFLKLTPQAVLMGKVVDADGEPMPRCQVMALQQRNLQGKKQWAPGGGGAMTNDVGEYRIAQLAPGHYILQASPMRMYYGMEITEAPKDGVEEGYVTTYYPNAMDIGQAVPVEVPAGGEMRAIDFKMPKSRVFRVKGKLVDAAGTPVTNVPLSLVRTGDSNMFAFLGMGAAIARNKDGSFEITGVTPGSYILMAPGAMNGEKRRSIYVPVEVTTKNVENVVAVATEGTDLTGTVRVEGDEKAQIGSMNISLQPLTTMFGFSNARVKDDKTFTLGGAMPGKYRVNANGGPDNTYVKAILYGGQDVLTSGIDLTGEVSGSLEIVLAGNAGKVTGVVQDDKKPAAGVMVVLVPEASKREVQYLYKIARTDQNGYFTLSNLPPGEYTAYAWEDLNDQSYQDPEFLKKYDGSGITVKLKEGESQNLQMKMIPTISADGQ